MSVDFMRLQPRFMKTGRYASAGASACSSASTAAAR
jgi:hypothetical protein